MEKIYAAACSLGGDVIRMVFIARDDLEAAKEALFRSSPGLAERMAEDSSVQVTFHVVFSEHCELHWITSAISSPSCLIGHVRLRLGLAVTGSQRRRCNWSREFLDTPPAQGAPSKRRGHQECRGGRNSSAVSTGMF